jgi:hypothetical protein
MDVCGSVEAYERVCVCVATGMGTRMRSGIWTEGEEKIEDEGKGEDENRDEDDEEEVEEGKAMWRLKPVCTTHGSSVVPRLVPG